jgi:drug/metabolite transporter (DMT)-like permease
MLPGVLMVTIAAASWGTWSLFLRPTGLPALVTSPLIFLVMALVTFPLALRETRAVWSRRAVGLLLANAAFDALNLVSFFAAMEYTTVAIAVITHYLAPILIAVAAVLLQTHSNFIFALYLLYSNFFVAYTTQYSAYIHQNKQVVHEKQNLSKPEQSVEICSKSILL